MNLSSQGGRLPPSLPAEGGRVGRPPYAPPDNSSSPPFSSLLLPLLPATSSGQHTSQSPSLRTLHTIPITTTGGEEQPLNLESRPALRTKAPSSSSGHRTGDFRPYPSTRPLTTGLTISAVTDVPIPSPQLYRLSPGPHLQTHFRRGSLIQLANGRMKKVEDLETSDFISSAETSSDVNLEQSTLVRLDTDTINNTASLAFCVGAEKLQVSVSAGLEHPFFVFGRGWSSCSPSLSMARYHLLCNQLSVGDVCISLTHLPPSLPSYQNPPPSSSVSSSSCPVSTTVSFNLSISRLESGSRHQEQTSETERGINS